MTRLRSDHVQVLLIAMGVGILNAVVITGASDDYTPPIFLIVAVVGWRLFEWEWEPLEITGVTSIMGAIVLVVTQGSLLGFWLGTELIAVVVVMTIPVLLVGGVLSVVRPTFWPDYVESPEQTPDEEQSTVDSSSDAEANSTTGGRDLAEGTNGGTSHAQPPDVDGRGKSPTSHNNGAGRQSTNTRAVSDDLDATYGDFDVGERIGTGGNADVHRATIDLPSGEHEVALKTPRVAGGETVDAEFFEQFRAEAETWDRLDDHEHVVTVHDWGDTPHPWIAMGFMEAGDLAAVREDLDSEERFAVLEGVAEALHHAHTHGVNHTDLKPGNVLFTERSGEPVAKVGDWGLANVLLEHSRSVQGFTPDYAAPEQVDPDAFGRTDHRTDVYQLGVLAYELLTGDLPFDKGHQAATINAILNEDPEPPSSVNPDLPATVDDALLTALAKEKTDRQDAVVYLRDAFRELA